MMIIFSYSVSAFWLVLLCRLSMTSCVIFDQSTLAFCPGDEFPEQGHRICYRRSTTPDACNIADCEVMRIDRSEGSITQVGSSIKIASPRFYRSGGEYQNQRLCQYNVPNCPAGTITHMEWNRENFMLESPLNGTDICLDFVNLFTLDLEGFGLALGENNLLCGTQQDFSMRLSGLPLEAEFRSDTGGRFRGFRIDIICTPIESEMVPPSTTGRRKRNAGLPDEEVESKGGEILVRNRRTSYVTKVTTRMAETNCTEVIGFSQPPIPTSPIPVPQTGNRIQVPRLAFLVYMDEVLQVVQYGKVLRRFGPIRKLFFHTGYNGTRIFRISALVPLDEIFGGGTLLIVKNCAYYTNFMSPPRLEPNCRELDIIAVLVNATEPFFLDQDIDDDDDEDEEPPTRRPPRTRPPPRTIPPTTAPRTPRPDIDPRVDPSALRLAFEFVNACNIYLRQAARSYIEILEINDII